MAETSAHTQKALTQSAPALSGKVNDKVIVLFKNQLSALPDAVATRARRNAAIASIQRPVISQLRLSHAQSIRAYQIINGLAATVSPAEAARLAANPAVAKVMPDEQIKLANPLPGTTSGLSSTPRASGQTPLPGACAPKGKVQLDPEAIEQIHAATQNGKGPSAQGLGYTGAGVKVGYIADGVDPKNQDFIRSNGQHVFVDYQDFSNTGSNGPTSGGEAFLDSSSIAAQGLHTYNVAGYGDGLNQPCRIRILGVAPGASLVGLDVFGSLNEAFNSVFVQAINYAVNVDHVNVLNESFGDNPFPDTGSLDLVRMADDAAVAAGTTVTTSSGDAGDSNTIGSPGTDPNVISAGATTTYRGYAQTGIGGIFTPGIKGWLDNNISGLSSAGYAQNGKAIDVVAPGDLNWTLCTPKPKLFAACTNFSGQPASVSLSGGTSEAAPLTAGVAALVIQAYAKAHGGNDPSPAVVKRIITSTTEDVGAPAEQQGNGMLDAYQAVLAAKSFPGSSGKSGNAILAGSNQLHAAGSPGSTQKLNDTITNDGSSSVTVGVSSRVLGTYSSVKNTKVTLSDSTGNAATVSFTVPKGQARLQGLIAFKGPGPTGDLAARVNLSLIDPNGDLAEYNLPQGTGNFSIAQVANPVPGKWTALISSAPSADGGTTGSVLFGAQVAQWKVFGTLSAHSLTLAPGASKQITLTAKTPASPGDEAAAIVLSSSASEPSFAKTTTIAVTLRSLIPAPSPSTSFTGTLSGGNGRQQSEGQAAFYQVQIPSGLPELDAQITMANSSNPFVAMLVAPTTHQAASTAANSLVGIGAGGTLVPEPQDGAELHVLHPSAGLWTLIIGFYGQVSGTTLSQPFTVRLGDSPAAVSASGLPDSVNSRLASGTSKTVDIHVTNNTKVPEEYFVDGRLTSSKTYALPSQTDGTVKVPITGIPPEFFVPSHTTAVTAGASAAKPVYFDYWSYFGDPDLLSSNTGKTSTGMFKSAQVTNGLWIVSPFQKGPDGTKAIPPVTTTTSLAATARAFDPSVSSPTGDLWEQSINLNTVINPYVVEPGQSVTIPVTITPQGKPGTTVTGTIFIDDTSLASGDVTWALESLSPAPSASDVAAFPYKYTVK
ncbi:MAG TPA: S8 family serine peptidase [Streptosporangiaceae bacterium]